MHSEGRASQQSHCAGSSSRCYAGSVLTWFKGTGCGHGSRQLLAMGTCSWNSPLHISTAGTKPEMEPDIKAPASPQWPASSSESWRFYTPPNTPPNGDPQWPASSSESPPPEDSIRPQTAPPNGDQESKDVGQVTLKQHHLTRSKWGTEQVGGPVLLWAFHVFFWPSACLPSESSRQCKPNGLLGKEQHPPSRPEDRRRQGNFRGCKKRKEPLILELGWSPSSTEPRTKVQPTNLLWRSPAEMRFPFLR